MEDPAGLRRPEFGTSRIERREEQHFETMEIGSKRGRERGQPFGEENNFYCVEGVLPPPLFIGGGGGDPLLEEGAALGLRPRVSSSLGRRQGGGGKLPGSSPKRPPLLGPFGPCAPSPLGPSK